jgi:hypothetical protein
MFSFLYHYRTWLYIWVTQQELLTLREHMSSHPIFWWVRVAPLLSFLCYMYSRSEFGVVQSARCNFCMKTMFGLSLSPVFCLIYVICVCLCIVMSHTYCVVFLYCLSSSCVSYVIGSSGLFLYCLSSSCVSYVIGSSGLFLYCLSSSCVSYVIGSSGLSIFDYLFRIL